MRKRFLLLFLCIAFLSLACKLFSSEQHEFHNDSFSFDYPPAWQPMSELWPNYQSGRDYYALGVREVVMVTSARKQGESGAYFAVASAALPAGLTLEDAFRQAYDPLVEEELRDVTEGTASLDGLPGFEIAYQRPWGEPWWRFRDIWIERDGDIYVLSFHALPGAFDDFQEDFDAILDSFQFAE